MKTIKIENSIIVLSDKINLSSDFLDFAFQHIHDNLVFWHNGRATKYLILTNIHIYDRYLTCNLRAITLKYCFAKPIIDEPHMFNYCVANGYVAPEACYATIAVAKTSSELCIKLNLEHNFPTHLNNIIEYWDKPYSPS